jgi:hypothetical protein
MARFRIMGSRVEGRKMAFEVQVLSGAIEVGEAFSVWDCTHRFDFVVSAVRVDGEVTRLVCTSEFLRHVAEDERWPDLFAGKEVDTQDARVAQSFSHWRSSK